MTREDVLNMSFEEVKEKIEQIQKDPSHLLDIMSLNQAQFPALLDKMMTALTNILADDDREIDSLGDQEILMLQGCLMQIPYILVRNQYPDTWELCGAVLLLVTNYLAVFPNESLSVITQTIYNLYITANRMGLLITAADYILDRWENLRNSEVDIYGVSQSFTNRLLHNFEEENKNDSTSGS